MVNINTLVYNNFFLIIYLSIAIAVSLFWILRYYFEPLTIEIKKSKEKGVAVIVRDVLSDLFVLSSGLISLYALLLNFSTKEFTSFDIFLASVVVISISGYAYKLFDELNTRE